MNVFIAIFQFMMLSHSQTWILYDSSKITLVMDEHYIMISICVQGQNSFSELTKSDLEPWVSGNGWLC